MIKEDIELENAIHEIDRPFKDESFDKAIRLNGNATCYLEGDFNAHQLKHILWILENRPKYQEKLSTIYPDD